MDQYRNNNWDFPCGAPANQPTGTAASAQATSEIAGSQGSLAVTTGSALQNSRMKTTHEANNCARAITAHVEKVTGKELPFDSCLKIVACVQEAMNQAVRDAAKTPASDDPQAATIFNLHRKRQGLS
jgi:hypothetical protein